MGNPLSKSVNSLIVNYRKSESSYFLIVIDTLRVSINEGTVTRTRAMWKDYFWPWNQIIYYT
jgi:hypothetical protein